MALSEQQSSSIEELLLQKIRRKLDEYSPETNHMPFHIRLLGKDRMALFSFIQSVNTMLGAGVFEQIAEIVAKPYFRRATHQYKDFNNTISENAQAVIQRILDGLRSASIKSNKLAEIEQILEAAQTPPIKKIKQPRIDLFLEAADGTEYYFDLKTAKPNIGEIIGYKRTLLEWVAIRSVINPLPKKIVTALAIPYNPYEPQPYDRWTFQGMFDLPNELKVADEFWDFLGGEGTYTQLLRIFETVGVKLRPEIDRKFTQLRI